jgi:predicted DNA-binding ribbon-helix-helix protein
MSANAQIFQGRDFVTAFVHFQPQTKNINKQSVSINGHEDSIVIYHEFSKLFTMTAEVHKQRIKRIEREGLSMWIF